MPPDSVNFSHVTWNDTAARFAVLLDSDGGFMGALGVDITSDDQITVVHRTSSQGTHSSVNVDSASTLILDSNVSRTGFVLHHNDSGESVFLRFDSSAAVASTDMTFGVGEEWFDSGVDVYTGQVRGIVSTNSQNVRVVEFL